MKSERNYFGTTSFVPIIVGSNYCLATYQLFAKLIYLSKHSLAVSGRRYMYAGIFIYLNRLIASQPKDVLRSMFYVPRDSSYDDELATCMACLPFR